MNEVHFMLHITKLATPWLASGILLGALLGVGLAKLRLWRLRRRVAQRLVAADFKWSRRRRWYDASDPRDFPPE